MRGIRLPAAPAIDRSRMTPLPTNLVKFVRTLADGPSPPFERRKSQRIPISIPIPATPLDKQLVPTGQSFMAMSRNISAGGMSLIYTRPVPAEFLVVTIDAEGQGEMRLLMHIQRCRRIERFFEFCGKFVARVDE